MSSEQQPQACRRACALAVDRAYGEISSKSALKLDDHLRVCPACAEFAAQFATIADTRTPGLTDLVPARVVAEARLLKLHAVGQGAVAWSGRVVLAFLLALACTQPMRQSAALSQLPAFVSWLVLFSWTVLHAWLLDRLLARDPDELPASAHTAPHLHGRAVAYGVLAAVALSVMMVGMFLGMDSLHNFALSRRVAGVLPDAVALLSSGALLLVGLAMGAKLGRESSPNMLAVLLLYAGIMFPALLRGAPAMLAACDLALLLCLVGLWGFSGAYLGSLLSRPRSVQSARPA